MNESRDVEKETEKDVEANWAATSIIFEIDSKRWNEDGQNDKQNSLFI